MISEFFKHNDHREISLFGKILEREIEKMARFAVIHFEGKKLSEKDITFHPNAFEACKHLMEAPIGNGKYHVLPVRVMEEELKRIIEGKVIEKESQLIIKKSKGLDLER